jgi:hypothetical protein
MADDTPTVEAARTKVIDSNGQRLWVDALIAAVRAERAPELARLEAACRRLDYRQWQQAIDDGRRAELPVCCVCSQPTISGGYVCDVCFAARS